MKTLDQHNADALKRRSEIKVDPAGVACPVCETEMVYKGIEMLLSNPGRRKVECPKCKYEGTKVEGV